MHHNKDESAQSPVQVYVVLDLLKVWLCLDQLQSLQCP